MSKRFMTGMIMLDSTITPGSSTNFDHGQGTIGDSGTIGDVYYDPSRNMYFTYLDDYQGLGWYGDDDATFFESIQDGWMHYA